MRFLRGIALVFVFNTALYALCLSIGLLCPDTVMSIPMLKRAYEEGLKSVEEIQPYSTSSFTTLAYRQLTAVATAMAVAAVTVFSASIDLAMDGLLRGVYIHNEVSENLSADTVIDIAFQLGFEVPILIASLSAAAALGVELWRALLFRRRPRVSRLIALAQLVALGILVEVIYIPAIDVWLAP